MRKMMVVALREYKAAVRTKSFLITVVIMPILMGGGVLAQLLFKGVGSKDTKKFAVVNRSSESSLIKSLKEAVEKRNQALSGSIQSGTRFEVEIIPPEKDQERQRLNLSERVRSGELVGFLEVGENIVLGTKDPRDETGMIRYQSDRPGFSQFHQFASAVIYKQVQRIRAGDKVEGSELDRINKPVMLAQHGLTREVEGLIKTDPKESQIFAIGLPVVLIMLMFMIVMISATPLMQGVLEEKMQRIAEVLLGSIPPFELMLGKLLGTTFVSLTIVLVYVGGGYWVVSYLGFANFIPVHILVWFLVFQMMATLMFGSIFIAIGAACTEIKETQNLMVPVMLIFCIPLFLLGIVIKDPNGPVATVASFIPFATPMLMIARLAIPPGTEVWQPMVGVVLSLIMTVICVYVAGRIFRVGILMQGKGAKFSDLARWVIRG